MLQFSIDVIVIHASFFLRCLCYLQSTYVKLLASIVPFRLAYIVSLCDGLFHGSWVFPVDAFPLPQILLSFKASLRTGDTTAF